MPMPRSFCAHHVCVFVSLSRLSCIRYCSLFLTCMREERRDSGWTYVTQTACLPCRSLWGQVFPAVVVCEALLFRLSPASTPIWPTEEHPLAEAFSLRKKRAVPSPHVMSLWLQAGGQWGKLGLDSLPKAVTLSRSRPVLAERTQQRA